MRNLIVVLALVAGGGDLLAGVLMLVAPHQTFDLLGLARSDDPTMVRFLGNFVATVGLATLYPFFGTTQRRWQRLAVTFEVAALVRMLVAVFVSSSILSGLLTPAWWLIAASDLCLAVLLGISRPALWGIAKASRAEDGSSHRASPAWRPAS